MFFDNPKDLKSLATESGFSIFILPSKLIDQPVQLFHLPPNTTFVDPNEKDSISVNMVREISLSNKETTERFIVIRHADRMTEEAANASLKILEEPKENYHLVFLSTDLSSFLPTILSRAAIYILKPDRPLDAAPAVDEKTLNLAKQMIAATSRTVRPLVDTLTDKKRKNPRRDALEVTATAIELLYKSYFKTGNPKFLKKLPRLLKLHENLKRNGHIKLQLYDNLW